MAEYIYVVDDDPMNLIVVDYALGKQGKSVFKYRSGAELLSALRQRIPDLILLDIKMPEMDGFETFEKVKEFERRAGIGEIPVIFLTAEDDNESENRSFKMGISDYIRKPIDPEILVRRIENVLDNQETIRYFKDEASRDKLTGLYNKFYLNEKIDKLLSEKPGYFMVIDLDSFKLVNDLYGHEMGDKVLTAFSKLLSENFTRDSLVARIGGDEFVAFATNIESEDELKDICSSINFGILHDAKNMMGENMGIPLGVSVGAVKTNANGEIFKDIFSCADKALYKVKNHGKHGCCIYREEEENPGSGEYADLHTINTLYSERNIPDSALLLDKDSFLYVYRFVYRYLVRYQKDACKVLFTLRPKEHTRDYYESLCDDFCMFAKNHLRKSDLIVPYQTGQIFIFLTEANDETVKVVVNNILSSWKREKGDVLEISHEVKYVEDGI